MLTLRHRKTKIAVRDFAQASAVYSTMRDQSDEGYSTWQEGRIHNERGRAVARISYNGRVWALSGDTLVYDNRLESAS